MVDLGNVRTARPSRTGARAGEFLPPRKVCFDMGKGEARHNTTSRRRGQ